MFAPKFSHKPILTIAMAIALGGFCSTAFAQGVFEGSGEEDNSGCVGDGCGMEFNEVSNSTDDTQSDNANGVETVDENGVKTVVYGTDSTAQDSVAQDSTKAADSTKVTEFFDDEDTRANYVQENASEYRARKEGFSKSIQFGFRAGAGANMNFLGNHTDGWNVGFDLEAGAIAKLPIGNDFSAAAGLDFSYRTYSYEGDNDYSHNEASISEMLFQIPAFIQYAFDEDGFFLGLGANISLKMSGETEFKQTVDTKDKHYKDKRSNTMPTVGVELGSLLNIGYVINKNLQVDLRYVQNYTNLLDQDVIAESTLMKTKLFTSHVTLGVTLLL